MPGATEGPLRVLIADDSAGAREALTILCSAISGVWVVGRCEDGLEAVAAARSLAPDVLILDIRMPKMSGLEVLKALGTDAVRPTVIVLTGCAEEECRRKCLELGADYFLHKPGGVSELFSLLRDLEQRGTCRGLKPTVGARPTQESGFRQVVGTKPVR